MALRIETIKRPHWTPLEHEGVVGVKYKSLFASEHVQLAMLHFDKEATIHEHPAEIDVDVICLGGSGFTSVGHEKAAIIAGERVRWPAGKPHRLWTTGDEMITLMVEHMTKRAKEPAWEDVDSSMIRAFKYHEAEEILEVMFHKSGLYCYYNVPVDVVEGLRQASSKGRYMRYAIIDRY